MSFRATGRIGVFIDLAQNVTLVGNKIGVLADGVTPAGNVSHGILITRESANNRIGGEQDGEGNTIAFNGGNGVLIGSEPTILTAAAGVGNSLLRNLIYSNGPPGHRLGA